MSLKSSQTLADIIHNVWNKLTDAEIEAYEESRDIFFIAVKKKHGMARAQAELFLNELKGRMLEAA